MQQMTALPTPVSQAFKVAETLTHLAGQYEGAQRPHPESLARALAHAEQMLWLTIGLHFGQCTCDTERDSVCPSFDVHSELQVELEISRALGIETGDLMGVPRLR